MPRACAPAVSGRPGACAALRRLFLAASLALVCFAWLAPSGPAGAQEQLEELLGSDNDTPQAIEADGESFDKQRSQWAALAERAESVLARGSASAETFEALRRQLAEDRAEARAAADRAAAAAAPLRAQLAALGEPGDASQSAASGSGDQSGDNASADTTEAGSGSDAQSTGQSTGASSGSSTTQPESTDATKGQTGGGQSGEGDGQDKAADQSVAPITALEKTRLNLQTRLDALEQRRKQAELAYTRASSLIDEIDALIRTRLAEELMSLGPSPLDPTHWPESAMSAAMLGRELAHELAGHLATVDWTVMRRTAPPTLAVIAVGVFLIWGVGRVLRAIAHRVGGHPTRARRAALGSVAVLARLAAPLIAVALFRVGIDESGLLGAKGEQFANYAAAGLTVLVLGRAVAGSYYSPDAPELRISRLDDAGAARAMRWAVALSLCLCLRFSLVESAEKAALAPGALAILNFVIITVGAFTLWRLAAWIRPQPEPEETPSEDDDPLAERMETAAGLGRRISAVGAALLRLAATAAVALAATGYMAGSQFVFYPVVLTLGVIGADLVFFSLLREAVEARLETRGAEAGGLRLLTVFFGFLLICATLPLVALIWGARTTDLYEGWRLLVDGIDLGGVHVTPAVFLTLVAVFGVGYALTRLAQTVVATSVLPNTKLDAGARNAIVTGMGWMGVVMAALLAVGVAGINLSSIAIVAGALSVGIGFGLQSIASNFISGVILMLERPIKVGDWIMVGGDHGIVKRVSVRATEIETFDKTSLILPNSELISGRVVNYTHGNSVGRLILKVGVSYGSDLRRVERILYDVAQADRRVLRYPAPMVLFSGFGESSIDFELRVILRDVNQILYVQTDSYFEIARRFAEDGIEIPYPQRVMHLPELERVSLSPTGAGYDPEGAADLAGRRRGVRSAPRGDASAAEAAEAAEAERMQSSARSGPRPADRGAPPPATAGPEGASDGPGEGMGGGGDGGADR